MSGKSMLSESQLRQIVTREPKFIEKLQRMEALSIQLCKLLRHSIFTLGHSLSATGPRGKALVHSQDEWLLFVDWDNYCSGYIPGGRDEVTYVVLEKRVKGWTRLFRSQRPSMEYQRDFKTDIREERRHLFKFDYSVVAVLDVLSDELEEQIARASQATEKHREQFRKVVEAHPRKKKDRFDRIDLLL